MIIAKIIRVADHELADIHRLVKGTILKVANDQDTGKYLVNNGGVLAFTMDGIKLRLLPGEFEIKETAL